MKSPVKFGKYYLLERINVGGMAEIFKAKSFGEAGFERFVAIKRILPSVAEDHEFITMFVDEAKLAGQLTHPNIAQIFELGKVNETYFIALEYVAGRDLRAVFERVKKRNERVPIPMACYCVMKLCEGLDYAHNKKDAAGRNLDLVHRDVSPQNILLSWDGDVKLIDFGIAKAASKSSRTQAGILKGKFGYMSPEQVRGQKVDRRSDVFAAGIVLYELLTGERLFAGSDDFSTLERVRNCDVPPPSQRNPAIPEELEHIVLKALAKNVEERHRTAMDLHDELQSFMYTSGHFFARKDLAAFMHRVFQEEISKEAAKDEEYRKFDSRRASDLDVFDGAQAPTAMTTNGRNVPPPPPGVPKVSVPPPPPVRGKSTMVGGLGAPTGSPPVPSPAAPASAKKTLMGTGLPSPPAKINGNTASTSASPSGGLEMDWDDDELATQVYDKTEIPTSSTNTAPPRTSLPPLSRGPVAPPPGFPSGPTAPLGASYAPPREPTQPLPSAGAVPRALPAIPAPPPMSIPPLAVPAPSPAVGAPMVPPVQSSSSSTPGISTSGYTMGPAVPAPSTPSMNGSAQPSVGSAAQQPTTAYPPQPQQKKNNTLPIIIGAAGLLALAASAALLFAFTRPKVGTIEVSSNVPDVQLEVDGRTMGVGQRFTVADLSSTQPHHIVARRAGYRTRELQVHVASGEVTPVQVVLEPEQLASNTPQQPQGQAPLAQPVVQPQGQAPLAQPVVQPQGQPPPAQPVVQPQGQPPVMQPMQPQGQPPPAQPVQHTQRTARPSRPPRPVQTSTQTTTQPPPRITSSTSATTTSGGSGFLSISTRPASRCTVAGQTFSTPRLRLSLPAGTHRVQCQNPDFNVGATFTVTIRPGEETREINHPLN